MSLARLDRRTLLRAAGVAIGLPLLDAMTPRIARAEVEAIKASPRRMLLIGRPLGFHAPHFFPVAAGKEYEPTRYLQPLASLRREFTVFSGMSHRGYVAGHHTIAGLLTGVAPERMQPGDVRNTISLDQVAAARIGDQTRFPSLVLGNENSMSWNHAGVKLPSEGRATAVFKQLFIQGTPEETRRAVQRIQDGQSILDGVREQAKQLADRVGALDRERLDLMLTSIREAERRLQQDRAWAAKPKPRVDVKPFTDDYYAGRQMLERTAQWFELVHLALQTDSTRVISLFLYSHEQVTLPGVELAHHDASHHGQDPAKIEQLAAIEQAEITLFADFLGKLQSTMETGGTLLDRTQVLYAGNLGNASSHACDNLPILLAGGGFKHGGHVVYDHRENKPLSNLYVRMLTQLDLEVDRFGSSTGTVSEV